MSDPTPGFTPVTTSNRAPEVTTPSPFDAPPGTQPYTPAGGQPAGAAPYDVGALPWASAAQRHHAGTTAGAPPLRAADFPGTEFVDLAATLGGGGYTGHPPRTHPLAVLTLVLGVFGFVPYVGVAAIILGHVTLHLLSRNPFVSGRGLTWAGLVLGYVTFAGYLLLSFLTDTVLSLLSR